MGTLSFNGGHPSTVRVKNVQPTSFDVHIQEWSYLDTWHTTETISYIVVEAGHFTLPDGSVYDAGHFRDSSDAFQTVSYNQAFESTPVVFT